MNKTCLVIMPFNEKRKPVYEKGIKPAFDSIDWKVFRIDEISGHYNINRKLIEYIFNCDAIIADLTDSNPNVFYELGVANAISNKTIMITQEPDKLPFDIKTYRCIIYSQNEDGFKVLHSEIINSLNLFEKWAFSNNNPVQEFKPDQKSDYKLINDLRNEISKLKIELEELNKQKNSSVLKVEYDCIVKENESIISGFNKLYKSFNAFDDLIKEIKGFDNERKESKQTEKIKQSFCPRGHGELKDWNGSLRCWICGWPEK